MPFNPGLSKLMCKEVDTDCSGYRDVEAFGESDHGYLNEFIGKVECAGCKSVEFRAKNQGCFAFCQVKILEFTIVLVGRGSHNPVTCQFQGLKCGDSIVWGQVVAFEGEPFVGAEGHVGADPVFVPVFDDVDILDAEAFAGPEDCAGVMGLKDILEHNGQVTRALQQSLFKLFKASIRDKLPEVVNQSIFHGRWKKKGSMIGAPF